MAEVPSITIFSLLWSLFYTALGYWAVYSRTIVTVRCGAAKKRGWNVQREIVSSTKIQSGQSRGSKLQCKNIFMHFEINNSPFHGEIIHTLTVTFIGVWIGTKQNCGIKWLKWVRVTGAQIAVLKSTRKTPKRSRVTRDFITRGKLHTCSEKRAPKFGVKVVIWAI